MSSLMDVSSDETLSVAEIAEALPTINSDNSGNFPCTEQGCTASFNSRSAVKEHKKQTHQRQVILTNAHGQRKRLALLLTR